MLSMGNSWRFVAMIGVGGGFRRQVGIHFQVACVM